VWAINKGRHKNKEDFGGDNTQELQEQEQRQEQEHQQEVVKEAMEEADTIPIKNQQKQMDYAPASRPWLAQRRRAIPIKCSLLNCMSHIPLIITMRERRECNQSRSK
jgi:hypothetical protein